MKRINESLINNIITDYISGIGTIEISKKYNINRGTVQKYLIKNNIPFHKHQKSSLKLNEYFFNTYTPESCYWAGFILADGYIRKNRNSLEIGLKGDDYKHLHKLLKCMNCDNFEKVRVIQNDTTNKCRLILCFDQIKEDLENNFDIFNKKSLTCKISDKIPYDLLHHYIRGILDGDGTCCDNRYVFLGTYAVVDKIRQYFASKNIVKNDGTLPTITEKIYEKTGNSLYRIVYSKEQSLKIYHVLYDNVHNNIYLDRKKDKMVV